MVTFGGMATDADAPPPESEGGHALLARPTPAERIVALLEVLLCSDYPTQVALGGTLVAFGLRPQGPDGRLNVAYVATLSLLDTAVLVGLIALFLAARGERLRDLVLGGRPVRRELMAGLPLALLTVVGAVAMLGLLQAVAPNLHNVSGNPLSDLIRTPRDVAIFGVVIVVAGGIREEIQRAFLLHRFERWLGGGAVGLVVTSLAFGAGHLIQGIDAAVATGLLGGVWGLVYLRRRSAVAPMVSHSGFNLLQLLQFLTLGH